MKLKELARLAGVSPSTVSKVLHQKDDNISDATREHILAIAKQYNYLPASFASAKSATTLVIGVLVRNARASSAVMTGMLQAAHESGYLLLISESDNDPAEEDRQLNMLLSRHVDGLLWEPCAACPEERLTYVDNCNGPVVRLGSTASGSLAIDYTALAYYATSVLLDHGHTRIASIVSPQTDPGFIGGYKQALFDRALPLDNSLIYESDDDTVRSRLATHAFSGIVIPDYSTALRFYETLDHLRYSVPRDISVITLSDSHTDSSSYSPLTRIMVPYEELGQFALEQLVHCIEGRTRETSPFTCSFAVDSNVSIGGPYTPASRRVTVVGSINMDHYLNLDQAPGIGIAVTVTSSSVYPGGKCLNQAAGLALLGHQAIPIARVGNDTDSATVYEFARGLGIPVHGIQRCAGAQTGQSHILVQPDGSSMISIVFGANHQFTPEALYHDERLFEGAEYCLLNTEIPMETVHAACEICHRRGIKTVLKPSACSSLSRELLTMVDILVPNQTELFQLAPDTTVLEIAAEQLLQQGASAVIATRGESGCYIRSHAPEYDCYIPARAATPIDTSGACDAFISALVAYLLYGYDLVAAARIATCAAALSITKQGVTPALTDRDTLEAYINRVDAGLLVRQE